MRSLIRLLFIITICAIFIPGQSRAQFQVNVSGSRLMSAAYGKSLDDGKWGAGATVRYFVTPKIAAGISARYYDKRYVYTYAQSTSRTQTKIGVITGQGEYFLTTSALRPYIGLEAGLYNAWISFESTNVKTDLSSDSNSFLLIGPKAGIQYAVTKAIGLNMEASYEFITDRNYTSRVLFVNAGGFVKFGRR